MSAGPLKHGPSVFATFFGFEEDSVFRFFPAILREVRLSKHPYVLAGLVVLALFVFAYVAPQIAHEAQKAVVEVAMAISN